MRQYFLVVDRRFIDVFSAKFGTIFSSSNDICHILSRLFAHTGLKIA